MTDELRLDDVVRRRVIEIAAERVSVDPATVTETTNFKLDLNYDSLDDVEFVMQIEDEFDVVIPDDVVAEVRTVGDAMKLLAKAHAGLAPAP